MNEQLIQLYLEGFEKGYWNLTEGEANFNVSRPRDWTVKMAKLEEDLFGTFKDGEQTFQLQEFQTAMKRWDELKNSPLYKALE